MKTAAFMVAAIVGSVGCGGAINPFGDGGPDAAGDSQPQPDAQPDNNVPWPCGDTTCNGSDICVHPCCGGVAPICEPEDDAGACPPDFTKGGPCVKGPNGGDCAPPSCVPPPPYCSPSTTGGCFPQTSSRDCYEACA